MELKNSSMSSMRKMGLELMTMLYTKAFLHLAGPPHNFFFFLRRTKRKKFFRVPSLENVTGNCQFVRVAL